MKPETIDLTQALEKEDASDLFLEASRRSEGLAQKMWPIGRRDRGP